MNPFLFWMASATTSPTPLIQDLSEVPAESLRLRVSPGSRRCCLLGADLDVAKVFEMEQLIDWMDLGTHQFNSGKFERNGMIGTCHAGFIDSAHVRYAADLLFKIAMLLEELDVHGGQFTLKTDAGRSEIIVQPKVEANRPVQRDTEEILNLAGSLVLDLTTWHEIITWYDYSAVPFYTEKGSAFSPEDAYSNQLGVHLGKRAILRSLQENIEYAVAFQEEFNLFLSESQPLSVEATQQVLRSLDIQQTSSPQESAILNTSWFDSTYGMANYRRLLHRNYEFFGSIHPQLPSTATFQQYCPRSEPYILDQESMWEDYRIVMDLRLLYASSRQILDFTKDEVSQWDLPMLIEIAKDEYEFELQSRL